MSTDDVDTIIELIAEVEDVLSLTRIKNAINAHPSMLALGRAQADAQRGTSRNARRVGKATPNEDGHSIGDTVKFNAGTSRYLEGLSVTIVGTNAKSVIVAVPDEPRYRRFAGKTGVRCPNSIIVPA